MKIDDLKEVIDIMCDSSLKKMEIEMEGMKVSLEKDSIEQAAVKETIEYGAKPVNEAAETKELKSPMVGTFHFVPKLTLNVGDSFKKGDKICIVEAMKLMNEIEMPEDGTITSIELNEGDMVEYNQVLITYN